MEKARVEAFSDGVFAIVITLLILDIRLPEVHYSGLLRALIHILPRIFAYVMSFITIGLYWVSHHNSSQPIRKTDRAFLWLNILLLLFVSFLPFPTSLLGRYPFRALPIMIYGANLLTCNMIGFLMLLYIKYHPHLAVPNFEEKYFRPQVPIYIGVNGLYLFAIVIAPFIPALSYFIYGAVVFSLIAFLIKWDFIKVATPIG